MDLTTWLLQRTPPRALIVATPGGTQTRITVERLVRERGWQHATSPADANLLLVTGPVTDPLRHYLDQVHTLIPAPCARADIEQEATSEAQLNTAVAALRDPGRQRALATHRAPRHHEPSERGHDAPDPDSMRMPGDVPMADRADDRDGLTLDQLHLPLGPALPDWPAGLVVRTTLQGDIIQHATVDTVGLRDSHPTPGRNTPPPTARSLDSCARLLSVAGWPDAATTARRLRDDILRGTRSAETARSLTRWSRQVRRSRTLRWLLTGIGTTPHEPTTPPELHGDAITRLHHWIDTAEQTFHRPTPTTPDPGRTERTQWTLNTLPALLEGTELAGARLVIASLDPDLDTLTHSGASHD
ncbi:hypothetical protein [Saccharomonospora xinjiangensis]|uniref:Uncharacterized protein n=1 Tax=Saccharomonospora xinjiangensis XJ-54 TaxID=882086 RepID=I0V8P8_9PSEU|nr:hypothetical protein [Saccharomonospora xinjiangensis]EID56501.1 hypothetical protein SacxiDRAFT_4320 [Saccharomonospora xinjiangensis XJ-54]